LRNLAELEVAPKIKIESLAQWLWSNRSQSSRKTYLLDLYCISMEQQEESFRIGNSSTSSPTTKSKSWPQNFPWRRDELNLQWWTLSLDSRKIF
jgi:hypothetical protein